LPKIWSCAKVLLKNGGLLSFAKNMEICQVLPKIWKFVKFCQKYGHMLGFAKNMKV
jgi:hypothetical protein